MAILKGDKMDFSNKGGKLWLDLDINTATRLLNKHKPKLQSHPQQHKSNASNVCTRLYSCQF